MGSQVAEQLQAQDLRKLEKLKKNKKLRPVSLSEIKS